MSRDLGLTLQRTIILLSIAFAAAFLQIPPTRAECYRFDCPSEQSSNSNPIAGKSRAAFSDRSRLPTLARERPTPTPVRPRPGGGNGGGSGSGSGDPLGGNPLGKLNDLLHVDQILGGAVIKALLNIPGLNAGQFLQSLNIFNGSPGLEGFLGNFGLGAGGGLLGSGGFSGLGSGFGGGVAGSGFSGANGFGGTWSDGAFDDKFDFAQNLLSGIEAGQNQRPGSLNREVDGEKCESGGGVSSDLPAANTPPGEGGSLPLSSGGETLLGPGDYVGAIRGREHDRTIIDSIAGNTGNRAEHFSNTQHMYQRLGEAGRGDQTKADGSKKRYVFIVQCHGGVVYPNGTIDGTQNGQGLSGAGISNSLLAGAKQTGNNRFDHVTLLYGGCYPCVGRDANSRLKAAGAETGITEATGAPGNRPSYAYPTGPGGYFQQELFQHVQPLTTDGSLSLHELQQAVGGQYYQGVGGNVGTSIPCVGST